MKLLLKILFFVFAIFQTNIYEAKVFVFDKVVSETKFTFNAAENKNELQNAVLENDFDISCRSESKLVDYRAWLKALKLLPLRGEGDCGN